jgi:hypothetical protein
MELNGVRSFCNELKNKKLNGGQGRSRTADTRIFSPLPYWDYVTVSVAMCIYPSV